MNERYYVQHTWKSGSTSRDWPDYDKKADAVRAAKALLARDAAAGRDLSHVRVTCVYGTGRRTIVFRQAHVAEVA